MIQCNRVLNRTKEHLMNRTARKATIGISAGIVGIYGTSRVVNTVLSAGSAQGLMYLTVPVVVRTAQVVLAASLAQTAYKRLAN